MRASWLVVGLVGLSAPARGDVSIARAAAPPPSRAWMASCTVVLEHARDELARIDPRFAGAHVAAFTIAPSEADDCEGTATRNVQLDSSSTGPVAYSAFVTTNAVIATVQPWQRRGREWTRVERSGMGWVSIDRGRDLAEGVLRHAVDVCVSTMPAPTPPIVTAAPAALSNAEQAAWQLARWCGIQFAQGLTGAPGRTPPMLRRITARGDAATPILLGLAISRNAAARAVAAMGLGQVASAEGRAALQRLALDDTLVDVQYGCEGMREPVAKFAREALTRQ